MLLSCTICVRRTGSYGFVGAVHGLDESSFIELFELALTLLRARLPFARPLQLAARPLQLLVAEREQGARLAQLFAELALRVLVRRGGDAARADPQVQREAELGDEAREVAQLLVGVGRGEDRAQLRRGVCGI